MNNLFSQIATKAYFLSIVFFFSIQLNGQTLAEPLENVVPAGPLCGTPPMTEDQIRYTLDVVDKAGADLRNAGTTCLPIRIHIVTDDGGAGGVPTADVNEAMANLNNFYLVAGIEFYIASVNIINSTAWYTFDPSEEAAMTAANSIYDAVNIYFVDSISIPGFGTACGYAYFPANVTSSLNILMDNGCLLNGANGTFVHEFGHFFNLGHTHQSTGNGNTDPNAENVPRTGVNANCGTTGDLLCDTEADPNGSNDANCNFVNDGVSTQDENGVTYTPDIDNVMSYYSDACGGIFTPEQYTRIANGLATRLAHTNYNLVGAPPAVVTNPSGLTATINSSYGIDLNWTDNAANEEGYLIERSDDGGATWLAPVGAGVAANVTSFADAAISSNTSYEYRVKASNDSCNDYSNEASVVTGVLYCTPSHQSNSCDPNGLGFGVAIYNLQLDGDGAGDITNLENGCNGPLSIFTTTHSADVTASNVYTVEVNFQSGNPPSGSYYSQHVTIWMDVNQDGDFNDTGENLYQSTVGGGPTLMLPITIPATAINGSTAMRIRSGWSSGGPITSPCDYWALSEAEDYELVVSGGVDDIIWSAGAWNIAPLLPNSNSSVIIASNYDTSVVGASIDALTVMVNPGATLTISAGDYLRVKEDITVAATGSLMVKHQGSVVQVSDAASVTNLGSITVEKITPTMAAQSFMISGSPMTSETREGVFNAAYILRNHDTSKFVPNPDVEVVSPGVNNWADDNGNNWVTQTGGLNPGEGYMVFPQPDGTTGGSYTQNHTLGTLTNGVVDFTMGFNGTQNASPSILSNPYASAIDAEVFFDNANNVGIDVLYFWEHNTPLSNTYPGYNAANFSMADISMYQEGAGGNPAASGGATPTNIVSSGQGFGVKPTAVGTARFNNAMRVTGPNDSYRTSDDDILRDRLWVNVYNETYGLGSTTLMAFTENTSDVFVNSEDVKRIATPVSLYSELDSEEQLGINALGAFEASDAVTLGFSTQVKETQSYRISIYDLDGVNMEAATVYLIDALTGTVTNLSEGDYTFQSGEATYSKRFKVVFEYGALGANDSKVDSVSLYPNPTQDIITIVSPQTLVTSATVYDLGGRKVSEVDFRNKTSYQVDLSAMEIAVYFIEIATENGTVMKKVVKR